MASPWPFTIGGETFNKADFNPYTYVTSIARMAQAILRQCQNALSGASSDSMAIGTGSKAFTVLTADGVPPAFGGFPRLYIRDAAAPATNYMVGAVTAFNTVSGAITVSVDTVGGSGTKTSWLVTLAGENGAATGMVNTPQFLMLAADAGAVNERVYTPGPSMRAVDGGAGAAYTVDVRSDPEIASGTTYNHLAADYNKTKRFTNAAGCAVTGLRATSGGGAPIGFSTWIEAAGGAVTFTPSTSTINGAASFLFPAGSFGMIVSDGADDWKAYILRRAASVFEATAATLTVDRSHRGALILLNRSAGIAVTLPATDGLGIGADFPVDFQATVGAHAINVAGANVFDKSGGPTSVLLQEGQGIALRSNGVAGASGIWATQRGMSDLGASIVVGADCKNNGGVPTTQFDLDATAVVLRSAANGATVRFNPGAAIACNIATAGPAANGRDQAGAFSSSSFVHFYWIWNGAALATVASAADQLTGPTLPAGYTHWGYACSVRLDGSGNLANCTVRGAWLDLTTPTQALSTSSPSTSETLIDLSAIVPSNALEARIETDVDVSAGVGGVASHYVELRSKSSITGKHGAKVFCQTSINAFGWGVIAMPVIAQQIWYLLTNATNVTAETLKINVQGYKLPNGGE